MDYLSYKQKDFIENLKQEQYNSGFKFAHKITEDPVFYSQAEALLKQSLDPVLSDRNAISTIALGDWEAVVDKKVVLDSMKDRFFSKGGHYIPMEKLHQLDLMKFENDINTIAYKSFESGLTDVLEDWVRRCVMSIADKELLVSDSAATERAKTKIDSPLVVSTASISLTEIEQTISDFIRVNLDSQTEESVIAACKEAYEAGYKSVNPGIFSSSGFKDLIPKKIFQKTEDTETIKKLADGNILEIDKILGSMFVVEIFQKLPTSSYKAQPDLLEEVDNIQSLISFMYETGILDAINDYAVAEVIKIAETMI